MDAEKLLEAVLFYIFNTSFQASLFNPVHIKGKKAQTLTEINLFVTIDKMVAIIAVPWRV